MAEENQKASRDDMAIVLYNPDLAEQNTHQDNRASILESIEKTKARIKDLQDKIDNFEDIQSNLFIIKKRFTQQSTLDRLSLYYWDSAWYNKLLLGSLKASVIGLGFALQLTGAAILLLGLTVAFFGILVEHGKNFRDREQSLCDDVAQMEEALRLEVQDLRALDIELSQCLIRHNEDILKLCDTNLALNQTVDELQKSQKVFEKTIETLKSTQQKLSKSLKTFEDKCKTLTEELSETQKAMLEQIDENTELTKEINALSERVELSQSSLDDIHKAYVERVARLSKVADDLEVGVGEFTKETKDLKAGRYASSGGLSFFELAEKSRELSYEEVVQRAENALKARDAQQGSPPFH